MNTTEQKSQNLKRLLLLATQTTQMKAQIGEEKDRLEFRLKELLKEFHEKEVELTYTSMKSVYKIIFGRTYKEHE